MAPPRAGARDSSQHILISFEGNTLECATRIPGSLTAWDITDYYEETQGTPLELWNGNVKLESDRKIGRMKNLILKRLNPTTPSKEEGEAPPHPSTMQSWITELN
ncbi:hypothetical protein GBAR_LOCUS11751 [Geodia barretti]|uniref:Uncharacterized protein n=1 Tax=Geodia barretti TaxID=519541 RepID=A0AA35WFH9_GEOBA|nr:hypothetical protein GBAR_LOCUS11751 [Geodia barretti]